MKNEKAIGARRNSVTANNSANNNKASKQNPYRIAQMHTMKSLRGLQGKVLHVGVADQIPQRVLGERSELEGRTNPRRTEGRRAFGGIAMEGRRTLLLTVLAPALWVVSGCKNEWGGHLSVLRADRR